MIFYVLDIDATDSKVAYILTGPSASLCPQDPNTLFKEINVYFIEGDVMHVSHLVLQHHNTTLTWHDAVQACKIGRAHV